jgi:diadenosine tetraphosphate (Ap4A) HIT family hydrolase
MKSDPKECLYCQNNETLHNLMIEIAQLSVSRVFLFKEQTYRGRCLVSYKDHVNDLNELSDEDRNAFMADVARVTRAMQKAFQPEKINYGAYSDKLSHLHFHLAPKYVDGPDYGGIFQMMENVTTPDQYELLEMSKISGFVDRARGTGRPTKKDRRELEEFTTPEFMDDFDFDFDFEE